MRNSLDNQKTISLNKGVLTHSKVTPAKKSGGLGIITKSHSAINSETLKNKGFERVHDYILQDQSAKLLPKERVCHCLKHRIDKKKNRKVMYNESRKKAHWGNVVRCGSIWNCPVCAKKITEQRRSELALGNKRWKEGAARFWFDFKSVGKKFVGPIKPEIQYFKGYTYLLTLTNSHHASHRLTDLKEGQKIAMDSFFSDRRGRKIFDQLGKQFHITNYEVTYGKNGWHPHHHILVFSDKKLSIKEFSEINKELKNWWIDCCVRAGLPAPSFKHGADLRDGTYADQYIGKWGIEHEMTKGHVKKGKEGGLTPFDLLQLSIEDKEVFGKKPSKLFQEFAISFKGSAQLAWSRGLKALLTIAEKTDDEIANETEKESIELRDVDQIVFDLLKRYQKRHEFLLWQKADYENGCYGNGETERNLILLFEQFISEQSDDQTEFLHICKSLV